MFNDLRTMLLDHMKELGCTQVSDSTRKNLRRKLEEEFQDSVNIISDEKGRLVIYPDSISQDKLVLDILNLQQELSILKSNESDNRTILTKAALILRADILAHNHTEIWPPQLDELNNADAFLSTSAIHFYRTVIAGTCGDENLTVSANRQIKSFGQDLIHAVTRGKRHPPKHILLPLVVKSLTGNVELVNILNRFGHCVSYSVTEEIETALCIQKLQSTSEQGIAIPSKIHPNVFTTLAWDNIDRIEETLSGGGTSHRVNGIAVQPKFIGPQLPQQRTSVKKTTKRSIDIISEPLPCYNSGNRLGPPVTVAVDLCTSHASEDAKKKNRLWAMSRKEQQSVPSWTGFNIVNRNSVEVSSDEVGYLPTINAPATSMSTVYEVLNQSNKIMKALQLPYIV